MSSNGENSTSVSLADCAPEEDMNVGVVERLGMRAAGRSEPVHRIVVRCQQGDKEAFRELFLRYADGVYRHLCLLVGPGHDVDDLVQVVFLNVFQSLPKFRGQSAFSTWLFRITINVARQEIRVKSRRRRLSQAVKEAENLAGGADCGTPEARLGDAEQVYALLNKLSPKKRETFVLYNYEGYSLQEIADLLGTSVSTIGSRLQAARKELLALLAKGASS